MARHRLVFFDGEEALQRWSNTDGLYGSRHFAQVLSAQVTLKHVRAVILVDMIADAHLDIHREAHSTPWLSDVVFAQAQRLGYGRYFLNRPLATEDDHVPFLELGVPAVDIIDLDYGPFNLYWHTKYDTISKCGPASLAIVARVVLATLAVLEANLRSQPIGASLTWPLANAGLPSRREGRKSQTQPQLPTRYPDATRLHNPTDGATFFPVPAVNRAHLGHARTFPPALATTSLRPLAICRCRRRHSRLSTVGGETIAPPSTSACASGRVPCANGSDATRLEKGAHVQVERELRYREYEKEHGTKKASASVKHRVAEIHINRILKLDRAEKQHEPAPEVDPSELPADESAA